MKQLTAELEAEIVDRQAEASEGRVVLTKRLTRLAEERQKLARAFYAIPLELPKTEQDRISPEEQAARSELDVTEADRSDWQTILSMAIRLAGNCHAAYLKARPNVRRRFNETVLAHDQRPCPAARTGAALKSFRPCIVSFGTIAGLSSLLGAHEGSRVGLPGSSQAESRFR